MKLFIKKYYDGKWGAVREVSDNLTLKGGNDNYGPYNWVEVEIKKPPTLT